MWHKLIKIAGVVAVLVVVVFGVRLLGSRSYGVVTVINDSQEEIHVSVAVCRQNFTIPSLLPAQRQRVRYELLADSDYAVKVRFKSGRELEKTDGYVANGLVINDELHITDKDMQIVSLSKGR